MKKTAFLIIAATAFVPLPAVAYCDAADIGCNERQWSEQRRESDRWFREFRQEQRQRNIERRLRNLEQRLDEDE